MSSVEQQLARYGTWVTETRTPVDVAAITDPDRTHRPLGTDRGDDGDPRSAGARRARWLLAAAVVVVLGVVAALVATRGSEGGVTTIGSTPGTPATALGTTTPDGGPGDAAALADLRAIVAATKGASSFTLTIDPGPHPSAPADDVAATTAVFQAPDRWHSVGPMASTPGAGPGTAPDSDETISIGSKRWTRDVSGTFWHVDELLVEEGEPVTTGWEVLFQLSRMSRVERIPDGFRYGKSGTRATVTVRDGYLAGVTMEFPTYTRDPASSEPDGVQTMTYRFSAINSSPPVEEPPADQSRPVATIPECVDGPSDSPTSGPDLVPDPGGEAKVCRSGNGLVIGAR